MNAKKNKKSKLIYIVERRRNSKKLVQSISKKNWDDIKGVDLSILYENNWTTEKICQQFKTSVFKVINCIRYK